MTQDHTGISMVHVVVIFFFEHVLLKIQKGTKRQEIYTLLAAQFWLALAT
jgi:hypothetical protein